MKAISLWQPWAQWVALEWKGIETRTHARFAKLEGERIAIHAAKKWDPHYFDIAFPYLDQDRLYKTRKLVHLDGAIICTADVVKTKWLLGTIHEEREALCRTKRLFGLFLDQIQTFDAIPFRGRQGIFEVPDDILY
jgi:hypothetical protein